MNQPCALLRLTFFTCERSNNNWLRVAKTNLLSTAIESASQHTHTCIHCICATCLTPTSVVRILLSRSASCVLYRSFLLDNYIWFQCIRYWTMADMLPMYSYVLLTEVFGFLDAPIQLQLEFHQSREIFVKNFDLDSGQRVPSYMHMYLFISLALIYYGVYRPDCLRDKSFSVTWNNQ